MGRLRLLLLPLACVALVAPTRHGQGKTCQRQVSVALVPACAAGPRPARGATTRSAAAALAAEGSECIFLVGLVTKGRPRAFRQYPLDRSMYSAAAARGV